jgi:demethoxyubiquinone hydroxylase (CLK1/Coq7/Cat5 family)
MGETQARRRLIGILRSAYSGELAAGLAYQAHGKALSDPQERAAIATIEREEWAHRAAVGVLLDGLRAKPQALRELLMRIIGGSVGASCHLGSWILPMYFAGRLEHTNIQEYADAAACARTMGLPDYERALLEMADAEQEHEAFFLRTVATHPWLPTLKRLFGWG